MPDKLSFRDRAGDLAHSFLGAPRSNSRAPNTLRESSSTEKLRKVRSKEASRASRASQGRGTHPSQPVQSPVKPSSSESPRTKSSAPIPGFQNPPPNPDLDRIAKDTSEATLLTKEAAELAQAVLRLRTENKELRRAKIPSRTSSDLRNKHLEFSSVPRRQKSQQQDELTAAKDQIARLEAELEQEKLNYVKSEKARKQAVNAQALLTRTDPSSFDDEHFREQVENLQFKVGHWVRNQDWKVFDPRENIPEDIQKRCRVFEPTCPQYHHYLYSKRGIELLMEAHVWQFLGLEIFGQDLWALTEEAEKLLSPDKYGNPFADWKKYLERSIGEDQKEMLQAWRVASARLLAARKSPAVYTAIMNATQDLVLDFTEDEVGLLARGSLDIVKLELLCREAVQLDSVIQQQRPNYHFYPIFRSRNWKWGFLPTCMEIFGDDGKYPAHRESQEVKLVLRPGFRKFGNSAGKNYNQEISILNMVVELKGK